ncbi:Glycosyltransferase involved in cell wall bisynthesis [Succinivibrio dextrinosolvens DSM 3072]|uniref:Glycosyltransferase involved in cell wall bisynthesis n=1 Tax=Succinivibrio dextrinosolvens DSM 3072 TaxID=1123324 RepID=A0A1T4W033_9GAMM|nr:glycosyltransferase family 4 protein [Succinivibrio dextrinosolvens]SKA70499.1 Glycosyltransferase involved in cell wall bisynthesis [Succinivibrio dextrinosolvens DSM 3072]
MRKELLFIMPALFIGGAEKQYRYIMESFSSSECFHVTVLLLNRPLIGQEETTKKFIQDHKEITFYQLKGNVINVKRIWRNIEKIKVLFKQYFWVKHYMKKHHINAVMFSYVTQLMLVPLFKSKGLKVIFNERNTGRQICDRKFKISLLRRCDRVICNSRYAADYIHEKTLLNVTVFNNGIKNNKVQRIDHKYYNIIVPARINRIKNQMVVIDALLLLKAMIPFAEYQDIRCILAGGIQDENYYYDIKDKIKKNKLNVTVTGFISNINSIYETTDLLILPSFEEGTPNVLLEAYMNSIPALVSDIPMNRDCCLTGDILFNPCSPDELARKILLWMNDKMTDDISLYNQMNYNYLINNYSMDILKEKYLDFFSRI